MKKVLIYSVLGLISLVLLVYIWGLCLPAQRSYTHTQGFKNSIEKVFAVVTDLKGQEKWRTDIQEIQVQSTDFGKEKWVEIPKNQPPIQFQSTVKIPNQRHEMTLEGQGFKGHWVGIFEKVNEVETKVSFTETVTIDSPISRVFAYLFVDLNSTMAIYSQDLSKKLEQ